MSLTIKQNYLTKNDCYKSGRTITPIGIELHSIGTAQNKATALMSYWNQPGIEACVHYLCDAEKDDTVYHILPDDRRSWADAGFGNGNAITIEMMESSAMQYSGGANFTVLNSATFSEHINRSYSTAVKLCAKLCKEHALDPQAKLSNGLHVIFSHDEARIAGLASAHVDPSHIWSRTGHSMDAFRADVKKCMGESVNANKGTSEMSGAPASKEEYIAACSKAAIDLYPETKILPSVVIAQCCLETGYGMGADSSALIAVNNLLGMKSELLNSTWKDHMVWTGESIAKITPEYYNGKLTYITDYFRKYANYKECIHDYENFLLYVKLGANYKYRRIQGVTDPETFLDYLYNNGQGYATDPNYKTKILKLIKDNKFVDKYDSQVMGEKKEDTEMAAMHPWVSVAKGYNTSMREMVKEGKKWYYSNSGCKTTWKSAVKNAKYKTNCARFLSWILRNQKILTSGEYIWNKSGEIIYKDEQTKTNLKKYCDIIDVKGKTLNALISSGTLKAGDMICFADMIHMCMSANGKDKFYDAGTGYEKEHGEGAKFTNWYGGMLWGDERVKYLIRRKDKTGTAKTTTTEAKTSAGLFQVKVTASVLNIRSGPSVACAIKGQIKDKGIYTITETSGDWGKLLSGIGWICLDYAQRI